MKNQSIKILTTFLLISFTILLMCSCEKQEKVLPSTTVFHPLEKDSFKLYIRTADYVDSIKVIAIDSFANEEVLMFSENYKCTTEQDSTAICFTEVNMLKIYFYNYSVPYSSIVTNLKLVKVQREEGFPEAIVEWEGYIFSNWGIYTFLSFTNYF